MYRLLCKKLSSHKNVSQCSFNELDLKFKYFSIKRNESEFIPQKNFADRAIIKDFQKLLTTEREILRDESSQIACYNKNIF